MKKLQQILDSFTMYRLVQFALIFLVVSALGLSAFGLFDYSSTGVLVGSLTVLLATSFFSNLLLGKVYKVAVSHGSALITAMILFFVLAAPDSLSDWVGLSFAALVAMASKYIITWRSSHIFNPAAFGVLVVSLIGVGNGAWWIADTSLLVPMLIAGYLVLMKLRRFELFLAFLVPALALILFKSYPDNDVLSTAFTALTLYPLLFLGSIMLTEPATMPGTRTKRLLYGALVGVLFASNVNFGFIEASPHAALLAGNLFAFLIYARSSARLKLVAKKQLTPTTYEFAFEPNQPLKHQAGQFMELTLPSVTPDARGNRRTFTVASAPGDKLIRIAVKFYSPSSAFKTRLAALRVGEEVIGNHVAGDFTLPKNDLKPVVFVAGGIGITPFIAMLKEMLVSGKKIPITLYYFVAAENEIAYREVLELARAEGVKVEIRTGKGARFTDQDMRSHALDTHFYLSGPPGLVNSYKMQLQKMGIKKVHADYFTGY